MPIQNLWGLLDEDATVTEEVPDDEWDDSTAEVGDPAEDDSRAEVQDLEHRLGEIETDVEGTTARVESIRDSQEEVVDRIDELEDSVRRLLGVYEQITADVNPFTDADPGDEEGDFRFGVVGADAHDEDATDEESAGVVTFDDLRSETSNGDGGAGRNEGAVGERPDRDGSCASTACDGNASRNGNSGGAGGDPPGHDWRFENGDSDVGELPLTLAEKYATDVLVFEWLSNLVTAAGPAGSVKAISYYSEIGWISDGAEEYLLDVLSGPHLDVMVDPNEPGQLDAVDHAESYAYIRKLAAVQEMNGME